MAHSVSIFSYCRHTGSGKALKLGGKKDLDSFIDKLKQEGTGMLFC